MSNSSQPLGAGTGTPACPDAATPETGAASHFLYFRLALFLFAIVAGTEGCLTLQAAKGLPQTLAGLLGFLTAALLIGTAIVFEPLHALLRRRG